MFAGFEAMSYNLQALFARTFGLKRKVELGTWFNIPLRVLAFMRRLRGTAYDPFLMNKVRREERDLVTWYIRIVDACSGSLAIAHRQAVSGLLRLPDCRRGYRRFK